MAVTQSQVNQFVADMLVIENSALAELQGVWQAAAKLDKRAAIAMLTDAVLDTVARNRSLAVLLATDFYEATQDLIPTQAEINAATMVTGDLAGLVRGGLATDATRDKWAVVSGLVQKYVFDGARFYGIDTMGRRGIVWGRAAHANSCAFCRMLATRSVHREYVEDSKATTYRTGLTAGVRGDDGDPYHKNCHCVPVRLDKYDPPAYLGDWVREYEEAKRVVGNTFDTNAILSTMNALHG